MASPVEAFIRGAITKGIVKVAAFNQKRMPENQEPHPFMVGIHAPVNTEQSLRNLAVTGSIPLELNGRYIRIGPNPITAPKAASHHWFLGDGMVHGVRLENGKALWYKNRWIRSTAVSTALGEAPAPGPRLRSDTVNTNVIGHANKIWACVEAGGFPVELSNDLDTVAHNPFDGTLQGSFSAHTHRDTLTGELHSICYNAANDSEIRHVVVNAAGKVTREERIPVKNGPSIHDCMITKNYVIILDLPVTFSMKALVAGFGFPYKWNPEHPARVGLLPRNGSSADIVWCPVAPCYAFHPSNAFENDDGTVTLDLVTHATMFAESTQGPDSRDVAFERWTIDPSQHSVARKTISSDAQEFPRANENYTGQPYRYAYTVALKIDKDNQFTASQYVYKYDLQTGTRSHYDFGSTQYPSEFVFVPKPHSSAEDDGWLMGYVVNLQTQASELVILNAGDLSHQASVQIPSRIPSGFHGNWIAQT